MTVTRVRYSLKDRDLPFLTDTRVRYSLKDRDSPSLDRHKGKVLVTGQGLTFS